MFCVFKRKRGNGPVKAEPFSCGSIFFELFVQFGFARMVAWLDFSDNGEVFVMSRLESGEPFLDSVLGVCSSDFHVLHGCVCDQVDPVIVHVVFLFHAVWCAAVAMPGTAPSW